MLACLDGFGSPAQRRKARKANVAGDFRQVLGRCNQAGLRCDRKLTLDNITETCSCTASRPRRQTHFAERPPTRAAERLLRLRSRLRLLSGAQVRRPKSPIPCTIPLQRIRIGNAHLTDTSAPLSAPPSHRRRRRRRRRSDAVLASALYRNLYGHQARAVHLHQVLRPQSGTSPGRRRRNMDGRAGTTAETACVCC